MAVSPTPKQQEYVPYNWSEGSENTSLHPGAVTSAKFDLDDWLLIPSLLIAANGLVGNSLVLGLLGFLIQRNPFSVYILNLAGADALFLCSCFLSIIDHFVSNFYFPLRSKEFLNCVSYFVGLSLLAAISTERCLAVLFPIWHRCNRPKNTSAVMCTGLWALAALLEVTRFFICPYLDRYYFCRYFIIDFVWWLLLTCVMSVSSLTLLLRVQCTSQCQQPPRLYLLVLLTVLIFLLCGVPLWILDFLTHFHNVSTPPWLSLLLGCVNSSAKPFIYFFLGSRKQRGKREPLRVVLQRALGDEQELRSEARDLPPHHHP